MDSYLKDYYPGNMADVFFTRYFFAFLSTPRAVFSNLCFLQTLQKCWHCLQMLHLLQKKQIGQKFAKCCKLLRHVRKIAKACNTPRSSAIGGRTFILYQT